MKVLHFCMSRGWGGLEMASAQWAGLFQRHGHESHSIAAPDSPLARRLKERGLPVEEVQFREYFSPFKTAWLRRYVIENQIDAIFLQSLRDLWTVSPALIGLPVKLVGFAQMWLEGIDKKDLLHRLVHKRMDRLITLTPRQGAQVLRCIPFPPEKTIVLSNSIDPRRFSPELRRDEIRKSFGAVTSHDVLIGIVGRLDPQKGQREAIEAFAQARAAAPALPMKLVVVGDPTPDSGHDYLEELKKTARAHGVADQVVFAGFRSDIPEVMASLDIFLLNSYREAFGFVIVEAMMSGTAVIATNSGGVPDVVGDGKYGVLVPPKDIAALASAYVNLARNDDFRKTVTASARHYALENFDEDKNFAKMLEILDGIRRT